MKSLVFWGLLLPGCVSATSSPSPLTTERPIRIAVCDELAGDKHCQFEDFGQYDVGLKDGEFFVSAENLASLGASQVVFRVHGIKESDGEDTTKNDLGAALLESPPYALKQGDGKVTHAFHVKKDDLVEGKNYMVVADYGVAEAMTYIGVEGGFKMRLTP